MTVKRNTRAALVAIEAAGEDVLMEAGWQVAERAAYYAPTGPARSAATIHPEKVNVGGHIEVHVSWNRDRFWLGFAETGTEHQRATPFLRRAANEFR